MRNYRVRLQRRVIEQTTVMIRSDNEDNVEDLAIEFANHDASGELSWEPVDLEESYAMDIEEIEDVA